MKWSRDGFRYSDTPRINALIEDEFEKVEPEE